MSIPSRLTLAKSIAAVQFEPARDGPHQLGLLSQLPRGAELAVCGKGFNERTAKVACHGQFYFVFLQDIDVADESDD